MLPKTAGGWVILVIVIAVLLWGAGAAGVNLGNMVHETLTGIRNFFTHARGG